MRKNWLPTRPVAPTTPIEYPSDIAKSVSGTARHATCIHKRRRSPMMALLWILLGAALVVAVAIFHAMNPQAVDLNLYGYPIFGVPIWMLVGFPALAGLALGILMDIPDRVRSAWQGRRLNGLLRQRDKQIADLQARITV